MKFNQQLWILHITQVSIQIPIVLTFLLDTELFGSITWTGPVVETEKS